MAMPPRDEAVVGLSAQLRLEAQIRAQTTRPSLVRAMPEASAMTRELTWRILAAAGLLTPDERREGPRYAA